MPAVKAILTTGVAYLRSLAVGTGTATVVPSGRLTTVTTQVGTDANTNEKDLATYSLPAGSLATDGQAVKITAFGTVAANGNTKTIRIYFGSTVIRARVTTANGVAWYFEGTVVRTSATAQKATADITISGPGPAPEYTTPAETLANAVTIKVTGQNGTGQANEIVLQGLMVEVLP